MIDREYYSIYRHCCHNEDCDLGRFHLDHQNVYISTNDGCLLFLHAFNKKYT